MSLAADTLPRLPIFATVGSAYGTVFSRPWQLVMAMLLPLILTLAIWLAVLPWETLPVWFGGIAPFVDVLPFDFFGLIWFRLLLAKLSEGLLPWPHSGPRSLAYFWYAVFIYLFFLLPCIVIVIPVVAGFLDALEAEAPELPGFQVLLYRLVLGILLLWLYLLGRFSLLLPATAFRQLTGFKLLSQELAERFD